ncbi:phage tail tape measure protein [Clostridium perfringens]|nr:phage tail tape measure protein [Clostridium perfringens]MDK0409066.1 phage tail tape measure protein [Clostridium perfringens]MDK0443325.1 phage tail tape measure protein [Clostridium perfringens]MDK0496869.1 phage tail tape measure protein [Clostridium perfringens]MDK0499975.1 phage tail tape measure protein [Clostridium perfringens]
MAETIQSLLVELGLDATSFDKGITQANRSIKSLDKGFKESQKAIKLNENSLESYSNALKAGENLLGAYKNKLEILNGSYDKYKTKLEGLVQRQKELPDEINKSKEALKELASTVGKGSEQYKTAKADLDKLKAEFKGMDNSISSAINSLRNVENQMKDVGNKSKTLENDLEGLQKKFKTLDSGFSMQKVIKQFDDVKKKAGDLAETVDKIKDKTEKLSVGATAGIGAIGAISLESSNNAMKLKGALGLTEEEAQKLKETARDIAKDGFDFSEANDSLIKIKQTLGDALNPEQVEGLSKALLSMNKVFDVDMNDSIRAVSIMMKNFGIGSEEATDILVAGLQNGLDISGDFLDTFSEYSVQLNTLGYTAEDSFNLMASGMENGVFNMDKLIDMVKEGRLRLTEMNDASKEAIDSIGLNAETVQQNISAGGETARKQMTELAQKILEIKNPTEQARVATALFGTQFEDLGINGIKSLAGVDESLIQTKGKTQELTKTVEESFGAKMRGAFEEVKEPLAELGENVLLPMIQTVGELAGKFAEWFGKLDEGTQKFILFGAIGVAVVTPILGAFSGLLNTFKLLAGGISFLAGKFEGLGGKVGGFKGKLAGLAKFASNPLLLAGAVLGMMAAIGESEGTILKLQEKFGNLGLVFGGICEFISGVWQLTIGNIINLGMFAVDAVAAIFTGKTMDEAIESFNARCETTTREAMSKIKLETTRGMYELRQLSDEQLTQMTDSMRVTLDNIPLIVDGEFQQAAQNMANSLTTMNQNQLLALTNMNDTTRNLFSGIREGMSVDEIVPILTHNFELIKSTGKLNIDELKQGVESGMGTISSQMDSKSAEGANAVSGNMENAKNNVVSKVNEMANEGASGMARVAGNMIDESGKIPPEIQSNMEKSTSTIQNALSDMAKNIEKSFNDLCYNAEHYLGRIVDKAGELGRAFESARIKVYNFASDAMRYVDNASSNIIRDWNEVINTVNRNISGSVSIKRTITTTEVTKKEPATFGLNPDTPSLLNDAIMPIVDFSDLRTGGSSYNITTGVANALSINKDRNDNSFKSEFKDMKKLLTKLIEVAEEGKYINVENELKLDGRVMAKGIARYVSDEIKIMDKRQQRLGGVF